MKTSVKVSAAVLSHVLAFAGGNISVPRTEGERFQLADRVKRLQGQLTGAVERVRAVEGEAAARVKTATNARERAELDLREAAQRIRAAEGRVGEAEKLRRQAGDALDAERLRLSEVVGQHRASLTAANGRVSELEAKVRSLLPSLPAPLETVATLVNEYEGEANGRCAACAAYLKIGELKLDKDDKGADGKYFDTPVRCPKCGKENSYVAARMSDRDVERYDLEAARRHSAALREREEARKRLAGK